MPIKSQNSSTVPRTLSNSPRVEQPASTTLTDSPLITAPTDIHQLATLVCTDSAASELTRLTHFCASAGLAVLEIIVLAGVLTPQVCSEINSECTPGHWCPLSPRFSRGKCSECANGERTFNFTHFCGAEYRVTNASQHELAAFVSGLDGSIVNDAALLSSERGFFSLSQRRTPRGLRQSDGA